MNTEVIWLHSRSGTRSLSLEAADLRNGSRGFTWMDEILESEIARSVGRAAHLIGTAREFRSEEARVAGRRGGRALRVIRHREGKGR
jgi:general stress protein YciG